MHDPYKQIQLKQRSTGLQFTSVHNVAWPVNHTSTKKQAKYQKSSPIKFRYCPLV